MQLMQRYAGGLDQLLDFTLLRFLEVEVDFGAVVEVLCLVEEMRHNFSIIIWAQMGA